MDRFPKRESATDPGQVAALVQEAYQTMGNLLDDCEGEALLVDALCKDCPIVGATPDFCRMSGYSIEQLLGLNCRLLLQGVPQTHISSSNTKNVQDYCAMCRLQGLTHIAEVSSVQPNRRQDGSHFVNFFMLGLCQVRDKVFILGVQLPICEGLMARLSQDETREATEKCRAVFKRIRDHLRSSYDDSIAPADLAAGSAPLHHAFSGLCDAASSAEPPDFAFFSERLQDHCLLINGDYTALRREPEELAVNCLVFSDRPVHHGADGLSFRLRVDAVLSSFCGLPVLGFTKRKPVDSPDLFPAVVRCLGSSVLVGACGEAFARDHHEHFKIGFRPPPCDEVWSWALRPELPSHKRTPPVKLRSSDLIDCNYRSDGYIEFVVNDEVVLRTDTGRPPSRLEDYYAVVDVSFSTFCLSVLPSPAVTAAKVAARRTDEELLASKVVDAEAQEFRRSTSFTPAQHFVSCAERCVDSDDPFSSGTTELPYDLGSSSSSSDILESSGPPTPVDVRAVLSEATVRQRILSAVERSSCMVTVADPRRDGCPLIAASEQFEDQTGYRQAELLGRNWLLMSPQSRDLYHKDWKHLNMSCKTGAPFVAVIPSRKKNGDLFSNFLDLRGLTVARNRQTGEELWYLIGIHSDVSHLSAREIPANHLTELQKLADAIREGVRRGLSEGSDTTPARVEAANSPSRIVRMPSGPSPRSTSGAADAWCLLEQPEWKLGAHPRRRQPRAIRKVATPWWQPVQWWHPIEKQCGHPGALAASMAIAALAGTAVAARWLGRGR